MDTANSGKSPKRKAPPGAWKKGQSGNPKGAPRRGESWAELLSSIGKMTGPELAKHWDTKAKELNKLPKDVTLKELVVISAYVSLLRDFSGSIWDKMMDRSEGKVTQPIEVDWREEAKRLGADPEALVNEFFTKLDSRICVEGSPGEEEAEG